MPIDFDNMNYLAKKLAPVPENSRVRDFQRFMDRVSGPNMNVPPGFGASLLGERLDPQELAKIRWSLTSLSSKVDDLTARVDYQGRVIEQLTSPDYRKGWSKWETLGDRRFTKISSIANADGRLEVFGIGTNRTLWSCWQERPNGKWHDWQELGYDWKVNDISSARNQDGRLEIFVLGEDKASYNKWQKWPGGEISGWGYCGGQFKTGVSVGYGIDGRMELFALGINNDIQHKWQVTPNGSWSDWVSQEGDFINNVRIKRNKNNSLEMFAVGHDHCVYHKWQHEPCSGWSDWNYLGGNLKGRVSVGRHPSGSLEIFGIGSDDSVCHKWQDNGWSDWHNFDNFKSAGLVVTDNAQGLSVYSFSLYGFNIWRRVLNVQKGWSGWNLLSTESCKFIDVDKTKDGKEALFVINGQNQVQYSHQV